MQKVLARASAMALAVGLAVGCNTSPVPGNGKNALTPENTPAGTTGTAGASDAAAGGAASAESAAATAVRYREVTIPAGTLLPVRLNTSVASDTSRVEQRVDGTLTRDIRIGGLEALASGASLRGVVTNAERGGRVKGRATVAFRFNQLTQHGESYRISTRTVSRIAPSTKKRDAATIGIPAAGGAIIGGIIGGGDGAVKGGAIGGAAGTAAVLSTRGKEVRLAPGTTVSVRLASPLTVRVPVQ